VEQIHVADALLDYIQDLLGYTRNSPHYSYGLSPRAGLAILSSSRAWALMLGRGEVLPEDVQAVLPSVVGHRLHAAGEQADQNGLVEDLIRRVAIP